MVQRAMAFPPRSRAHVPPAKSRCWSVRHCAAQNKLILSLQHSWHAYPTIDFLCYLCQYLQINLFFFREGCCFPQDLLHHRAVCHLQKSLKWDNKAIKVRRVRNTTTGTWFLQAAPLFITFSCPQAAVLKLTLMLCGCWPTGRCFTFMASHHEDVPPAFSEFRDVIRKNGIES